MANPIKASDLYVDDGAIQQAISEWKTFRMVYITAIEEMKREAASLRASHQQLSASMKPHQRILGDNASKAKALSAQYRNYSGELSRANAKIKSLESSIRALNAGMKQQARETKTLKSSFSGLLTSAKHLAATYLGLSTSMELLRNMFGITKELDALDKAFTQVAGSTEAHARATAFLRDITERYGMELLTTSRAYMKFSAAIKTTNLGVEQAETIFESFAKVNSILGLSAADARGVFLALEQMISKGKVSTEELRLQMGERIPGAFQIMAKAVGVSSGELAKLLKQGKVMSADVLPKFAQEMEKAFGVENANRIDMLAGAQNRLKNAWTEFVESLNKRELFTEVLTLMTDLLKSVTSNLEQIKFLAKALIAAGAAWATYRVSLALATTTTIASGVATKGMTIATRLATVAQLALNAAVRANPFGLLLSVLAGVTAAMILFKEETKTAQEEIDDLYSETSKSVANQKREMEQLLKVAKDETKSLDERKKAISELSKIAPDYLEQLDVENTSLGMLLEESDAYNESLRERIMLKELQIKIDKEAAEIAKLEADLRVKQASGVTTGNLGMTGLGGGLEVAQMEKELEERRRKLEELKAGLQDIRLGGESDSDTFEGVGTGTGGGGDMEKTKKLVEGSLAWLKAQLKKFEEEMANAAPGDVPGIMAKVLDARAAVEEAEKYLDRLSDAMTTTMVKPDLISGADPLDVFTKDRPELEKELNKQRRESLLQQFDQYQEFQASGFALYKHTETEKTIFALNQKKKRIQKLLELDEQYGRELTETQRLTLRNQIQGLEQEIEKAKKSETKGIFELLGIKISDEGKAELKNAFEFAKNQLTSFFQLQKQLANQRVTDANRAVSAAQRQVDIELRLAEQGFANKVELAQQELELAKQTQRKALKQREKAAKADLAIQTIEQGVNLVTASSKILKTVPFPFSLAAIGLMFGAFAAAKIKAFQLTKERFSEGGLEIIGGGSHASGRDTPLGFAAKSGKPAYAERGEAHAVISSEMTRRYRDVLPTLIDSLNSGTFEQVFGYQKKATQQIPMLTPIVPNISLGRAEDELKAIRRQGGVRTYQDSQGRLVEERGNRKTIYV